VISKYGAVVICAGKGKRAELSLYLIKHRAVSTDGEAEVYLHAFLTSSLGEGEWSVSLSGRFTPVERNHDVHRIGGLVGLRAGLGAVEIILFLLLLGVEPQFTGLQSWSRN
jgi:hypothetical protein